MKQVTIYTDGACSGNPGPGGWGAILRYGEHEKELSGGDPMTTNNKMELTGVIVALEALREPCKVDLYSDSKYVVDGITKGWAKGWRARGWKKADKTPAKNPELWGRLLDLLDRHEVVFHWVKGHAENPYNNRCDELAVAEWKRLKWRQKHSIMALNGCKRRNSISLGRIRCCLRTLQSRDAFRGCWTSAAGRGRWRFRCTVPT